MPDGSRQAAAGEVAVGGIVRDPIDVRDRNYEPTLAPLAPKLLPDPLVIDALRSGGPWGLPRLQGDEGTCGGQALAAMIDLQRITAQVAQPYQVSARMIYECARLKAGSGAGDDGVSLRDVIKAFYNYGVCREELWPYMAGGEAGQLSIERARDARNLSLGAYYRLRPNLNTYHAALYETGAILASAELHDGWGHERVRAAGGAIVPPQSGQSRGVLGLERHAFVIVGYTPDGFLVLNSWGRDWGGWTPADAAPVPGVALWRYEDWADTIMDGWVLRLGVGAADAFDYSVGDQGLGFGAEAPVRSTPVHAILGNFLHLDDGDFVSSGAFVSTRRTLEETRRLLDEDAATSKPYRGVLLTFAGGLTGLRDATEHVARWKRPVRAAGWYPFTVLWCVDYVDQALTVLAGVFSEAQKRAGGPGPRLDKVVEEMAHGIGRALWRDIGRAAELSARPGGPLHDLARAGAALAASRPGFGLRIVAEFRGGLRCRCAAQRHADRGLRRRGGPLLRDAPERRSRCATAERRRVRRTRHVSECRLGTGTAGAAHSGPPAKRAGRKAPGGAPLRPLVLRACAAGLPEARRDRGPGGGDRSSAAPQDRGRGGLGCLERRATDGARAHWLAAGRSAVRPGTDHADPARLPVGRERPAQVRPAPEPGPHRPGSEEMNGGKRQMAKAATSKGTPKGTPKITVDELGRKLSDLSIPEEELARYFEVDEATSNPTRPELKLNPDTVQLPPASDLEGRARSAQMLNGANHVSKLRREARFQQIVNGGKYKGPLIAAEGDSWFQFPFILKDVIDWVFEDFAVYCRSEAGDTLDNMVRTGEYLDALARTGGRVLLLSGGGNDMVAGGNIAAHLRPFQPSLTPAQYLLPSFGGVLDGAIANIEKIVRSVGRAFPNAAVICHGYDYTVPNDGKWLGRPMASLGIVNKVLQKAIAREMVDRLNTRLMTLANQSPRISYVNCRGAVGDGRWHDELHPTNAGYADVAKRFEAEIRRLTRSRGAPETRELPSTTD